MDYGQRPHTVQETIGETVLNRHQTKTRPATEKEIQQKAFIIFIFLFSSI